MKLLIAIVCFIGGAVACYLLVSVGMVRGLSGVPVAANDSGQSISVYLSFVGVMLTAVTTILTAMAIGIGVIAAYTFSGLKAEARDTASKTAREVSDRTAREVSEKTAREVSEETAREVSERTAREVSEGTAREVSAGTAAEALSDAKIKEIVGDILATTVLESRDVSEWGPDEANEEER